MSDEETGFTGSFVSASGITFGNRTYNVGSVLGGIIEAGLAGGRMYAKGHRVTLAGLVGIYKKVRGEKMYRRRYERRGKK